MPKGDAMVAQSLLSKEEQLAELRRQLWCYKERASAIKAEIAALDGSASQKAEVSDVTEL